MKLKKALSLVIAGVVMCTALAGCGGKKQEAAKGGEANNEKKLIIYCSHPLDFTKPLVSEFEKQSGIKVEVISAGTGELLKRIESEKAHPLGDILWGGALGSVRPKTALFEKYASKNEDHIQPDFKNVEGTLTRFTDIPSVLMVNTKLIGNIKIDGYADLLNPALKGKIAMTDPSKSSSAFEHLVNMLYDMGNGDPEKGWDYVKKFCQNLDGKLLSGSSAVYKGVADGEYTVGCTFEEGGAKYVADGAPVKVIYMKDYYNGGPVTVDTLKEVLVYKREVFVPDSLMFLQTYTTRCDSCGYVEIIKKVDNKKGILYLDSGNYFEIKEK